MPNWCDNILRISGSAKEIAAFKLKAAVVPSSWNETQGPPEVLNLENFVPVPAELTTVKAGEARYNWEIEHWGCKWGVYHSSITDESRRWLRYEFQTPWTPPLAFIRQVSLDWPKVRLLLDYEELDTPLRGIAAAQAGKLEHRSLSFEKFEELENG